MTVNKLTLPAKENAVQSKINEIIDNLGTSITVDQTYNGTSANPQSGVAIEGELSTNYQPKLVSGTNIKTINNTSLLGSGDIDTTEIFVAEYDVTSYADVLAAYNAGKTIYVKYTGDGILEPMGYYSFVEYDNHIPPESFIFSRTYGTFIENVIVSYSLINQGSTTWNMTSTTAANTTLSNVSSIDSNSAVQTALDGKVSKSGDTMTGNLTMYGIGYDPATNTMNDSIFLKSSTIDINTVPSGEYNQFSPHLQMLDKNGALLAQIFYRHGTNGTRRLSFGCLNGQDTDSSYAYIGFDADGNRVCSFPNTTCVDGQVVDSLQTILSNGTSLNGSTNLTKRIDVPNDGHIYEVIIRGGVSTGSSSGNYVQLNVLGNQDSYSRGICACRTRTASSVGAAGSCIVYVSYVKTGATNITIERNTSYNGTINNLQTVSYRRVGTNS